jgi:hypothetical protein
VNLSFYVDNLPAARSKIMQASQTSNNGHEYFNPLLTIFKLNPDATFKTPP